MTSSETKQTNEMIIDNFYRNILKTMFKEGYKYGKIAKLNKKEILNFKNLTKTNNKIEELIKKLKNIL